MSRKKRWLVTLFSVIAIFLIGCNGDINKEIEDMTKEEFSEIAHDVAEIEILDARKKKIQSITTQDEINIIINIISNLHDISEEVEDEGNTWFLLMYNENNELICYASLWRRGYLGFGKKNQKEYQTDIEQISFFEELLNK